MVPDIVLVELEVWVTVVVVAVVLVVGDVAIVDVIVEVEVCVTVFEQAAIDIIKTNRKLLNKSVLLIIFPFPSGLMSYKTAYNNIYRKRGKVLQL